MFADKTYELPADLVYEGVKAKDRSTTTINIHITIQYVVRRLIGAPIPHFVLFALINSLVLRYSTATDPPISFTLAFNEFEKGRELNWRRSIFFATAGDRPNSCGFRELGCRGALMVQQLMAVLVYPGSTTHRLSQPRCIRRTERTLTVILDHGDANVVPYYTLFPAIYRDSR